MNVKLHIQLSETLATALLNEGLRGLPTDFAESISRSKVKSSEVIKLVIQRHLATLEEVISERDDKPAERQADPRYPNTEEDEA
jgi:hypothetical protein